MSVTKTEIKRLFNIENVKQYGRKQLFLVDGNKLLSYRTVVAKATPTSMGWIITTAYHSKTTTAHINFWLRSYKPTNYSYGAV